MALQERLSQGEKRVIAALAAVTLLGSGIGVARRMRPAWFFGPPAFTARPKPMRTAVDPMPRSEASVSSIGASDSADETDGRRIDLNRAGSAALQALPGIGPVLAERIIRYRTEHGDFRSVDALISVPGIGPKRLEALRPYLTVEVGPP